MTTSHTSPDLERHTRKCSICHHPDRDAIEEEFLHWHRVIWIAQQYDIPDHRSIYRHARAVGLIQARRENLHSALDNIVEQSDGINASASEVLRAIRAYSCLDAATGRWTELPLPPRHLIYSSTAPRSAAVSGHGFSRAVTNAVGESSTSEAVFASPASASKTQQKKDESQVAANAVELEPDEPEAAPPAAAYDDDPTDPASPNYIEQGPPPADDEELEPPPFIPPPIVQDRDFFDRLNGIDRRPYGRR